VNESQASGKRVKKMNIRRDSEPDANVNGAYISINQHPVKSEAVASTLTDPDLQREIRAILDGRLLLEIAPKALKILKRVIDGDVKVTKLQFEAAKDALARAGFVPPKAAEPAGNLGKTIAEKTSAELKEFVRQAQNALADRAHEVVDAPKDAPERDAKAAGLLD
jgi:hypothetical protein